MRGPARILTVVGLSLGWGLVGGFVASATLGMASFDGAALAVRYWTMSALLTAAVCVPAGVAVWAAVAAAPGARGSERRESVARLAAQTTAAAVPFALAALLHLHKASFARHSAGTPKGMALSAAVLLGAAAGVALVTWALSRRLRGGFRRLAWVGGLLAVLAGVVVLVPAAGPRVAGAPATDRPSLLVISIDSLRLDVFDEYLERHASAVLRRFVEGGRRYTRAHTTFSHSLGSHASLFTGLYPPEHGARTAKEEGTAAVGSPLRPDVPTLAEVLGREGYETLSIVSNPWLGEPFGLDAGFQTFVNYGVARHLGHFDYRMARDASLVGPFLRYVDGHFGRGLHESTAIFLEWLEARDARQPFFAFLHYIEMHTPNNPAPRYRDRFTSGRFARMSGFQMLLEVENRRVAPEHMAEAREHLRNLYLADLARLDEMLQPVLEELLDGGWLDDTVVFLLSDHGENFYERGNTYGKSHVYHTSADVPFLLHVPGEREGSVRDGLVSLVDVPATFYAYSGIEPPPGQRGVSLLNGGRERGDGNDWVYVEGWDRANRGQARALVFADDRKWIRDGARGEELYDLRADREELRELSGEDPEEAGALRAQFDAILAGLGEDAGGEELELDELDADVVERLRALGYVD